MRYIIESTKTNAGTRKIPITEDVADCFRAILEDREKPPIEKVIDGYYRHHAECLHAPWTGGCSRGT